MLDKVKEFLQGQDIDYLLLPNSDEFFLEYLPENKQVLKYLTGFTGSNAFVILGRQKSYFLTDGRYLLQASQEIDLGEFEIVDMTKRSAFALLSDIVSSGDIVALDSKLFNVSNVRKLQNITKNCNADLKLLESGNDFDLLLEQTLPNVTLSTAYNIDKKLVGVDSITKRKAIANEMQGDLMLVSNPENICWLLNMRGSDLENTPLMLSYGILFKDGSFDLFSSESRISDLEDENLKDVNFVQENCLDLRLSILSKTHKKIQIDARYCNYFIHQILTDNSFEIIEKTDPIELAKATKSDTEIKAIKKTHEVDSVALTKFLFWIDNQVGLGKKIDEILASQKLLELRKESSAFTAESFPAISAFGSNGSIIHYHPTKLSNQLIDNSSLYLIDSGGQYLSPDFLGTTDITRTISFGSPSQDQIENFTRVLKGHIALARVKFKSGTTGCNLDILARFHLMQGGNDYAHGTGHGVGCFLSVHEGPCSISKHSHQELVPNMVLSNEPGYYEEGKYGIRIENLVVVKEIDEEFLGFETISLAPIDPHLIDFKMITYPERKWLRQYHERILNVTQNSLSSQEKKWLENIISKYNS